MMLSANDMSALSWAISRAAEWRGAMTGNPDTGPLRYFDARLSAARAAMRKLHQERKREKDRAAAITKLAVQS